MAEHHSLHRAVAALLAVTAGCGSQAVGTAVDVSLGYDDALGLDTADVTLVNETEAGPIAHRLLLLVPDELDGTDMPIEVWGRKAGRRAAYGTAIAVPRLGKTVSAQLTLTACTPGCQGDTLTTCTGPEQACALGCSSTGDAHCVGPQPSNGIDPRLVDPLRGTTTVAADATFDVDTGAITGGLTRAAGTGVVDGIGYSQLAGPGGAPALGVFAFHDLTIAATATVRFTGARAAVLLVGDAATIDGTLDLSAGRGTRATPGPGGGAGGTIGAAATGCGPGGPGKKGVGAADRDDSGGGGGGGGTAGAHGGDVTASVTGGAGGAACLATLEPLRGGSGGGAGSTGIAPTTATGGGGGGALQITALGTLRVTGRIHAGGAGGEPSPTAADDAGSAGGGGAGGAILLEATELVITTGAILAANGGGGGGASVARQTIVGKPGDNAAIGATPAAGGQGSLTPNAGGAGGALGAGPVAAATVVSSSNGGGGGGAVGAIVLRGRALTDNGTASPAAAKLDVRVGQ